MYKNLKIIFLLMLFYVSFRATAGNYTYQPGYGVQCIWASTDAVGFYTSAGTLTKNSRYDSEGKSALLSSGWSLAANNTYYCFAPFDNKYRLTSYSYSSLPISCKGQTQTENNSLSHLTAYDFMTAMGTTTTSSADFAFAHLGSIVRVEWTLPKAMEVTSLTFTSEKQVFVTEANMNLTNNTFTSTAKESNYTLTIQDVNLNESETLVAYMMMLPTDLSSKVLTLTLTASDGTTITTKMVGCKILAGKTYTINVSGGDVSGQSQASMRKSPRKALAASSLTYPSATITDFPLDTENLFMQEMIGDVNSDGKVSIADVSTMVAYLLGRNPSKFNQNNADANSDGTITKADVNAIVNMILK